MLLPYKFYRMSCITCGVFERGVAPGATVSMACSHCERLDSVTIESCVTGMTTRPLPFQTVPHQSVTDDLGWKKKSRTASANGKSTGRPTKGNEKLHHGAKAKVLVVEVPEMVEVDDEPAPRTRYRRPRSIS